MASPPLLTISPPMWMTISWLKEVATLALIQNLIITILLGIWAVISIILVVSLLQTIIRDRKQEQREAEKAARDKEYHEKRMSELQ